MLQLVEYSQHYFVSITFQHISGIVVFVHMQVKDTFTWDVTRKSRIAPVQTAAKLVKKLLWRAVSRISLINQQSNPTAITCQYYQGNTPDFQTAYQKFHSSGLTYLNSGHQTMQACSYCIKWVAYFNSVSMSLFAQLNTESVNQILFLIAFFIISEIANI